MWRRLAWWDEISLDTLSYLVVALSSACIIVSEYFWPMFITLTIQLLSLISPLGVIPPFWRIFWWWSDCDGWVPGNHILPGGCFRWHTGGSDLRDPSGLYIPVHLPHTCHRATFRFRIQLHGLPVCWDFSSLRYYGVSLWCVFVCINKYSHTCCLKPFSSIYVTEKKY